MLGSIGALLILCCVIGTIAVLANGGRTLASLNATATAASANASANAYVAVVRAQAKILQADFALVAKDCTAENISKCKSDLQQVESDAAHFQQVLNQNPAPPCLKSADTELRTGLTDYQNGAALGVRGINDKSASEVQTGSQEITQGNSALNQASTDADQAKCS